MKDKQSTMGIVAVAQLAAGHSAWLVWQPRGSAVRTGELAHRRGDWEPPGRSGESLAGGAARRTAVNVQPW